MQWLLILFLLYVFCNCKIQFSEYQKDCLSKVKTENIRGILAILIIFHHLSQNMPNDPIVLLLKNIGVLCVSVFFFFSGYGLQFSSVSKKNYAASLMRKRIPSILIPYFFLLMLYWGFHLLIGKPYSPAEVLLSLINGNPIATYSWYILCILVFYLNFYFSLKLFPNTLVVRIIYHFLFCILWIFVCRQLEYANYWYKSIIAFPFGIFYAVYKNQITSWLQKHYLSSAIGFLILFSVSFLFAILTLAQWQCISFYWFSCFAFLMLMVLFLQKVSIGGSVLRFLGEISFEIYGIHGLFIELAEHTPLLSENHLFTAVFVLFCSIAAGWLLHTLFQKLLLRIYQ